MSAVAATLLGLCTAERDRRARIEAADPKWAASNRKRSAAEGWVSLFDDPNITVRASELEQLCHAVLATPPAPPNAAAVPLPFDQIVEEAGVQAAALDTPETAPTLAVSGEPAPTTKDTADA